MAIRINESLQRITLQFLFAQKKPFSSRKLPNVMEHNFGITSAHRTVCTTIFCAVTNVDFLHARNNQHPNSNRQLSAEKIRKCLLTNDKFDWMTYCHCQKLENLVNFRKKKR